MPGAPSFAIPEVWCATAPANTYVQLRFGVLKPDIARSSNLRAAGPHEPQERLTSRASAVGSGDGLGIRHRHRACGKVVESVTGQSLEAYFRQHVFEPLGMRDTSFLLSDDMARRLVGNHLGRRRQTGPDHLESPRMATSTGAAPDCSSTAPDYSLSLACCWRAVRSTAWVYSRETVKLMACNAIGDVDVPMVRSNNRIGVGSRDVSR